MKTVFITGAGQGIGRRTAEHFSRQGWFVGLYDVNLSAVEQVHEQLAGNSCYGLCDVTDFASVEAAFKAFGNLTAGRLDVVVNNAGVLFGGDFADIEAEKNDLMIDVNAKGVANVSLAAFPMLRQTAGSCLVNLSSVSAIYGSSALAVYSATKFFVRGLTEALEIEWAAHGIRVCSVQPPYVATSMLNNVSAMALKDKTGVKLTPEMVAQEIWHAVHGSRIHRPIGTLMKLAAKLPACIQRSVMKRVTGY